MTAAGHTSDLRSLLVPADCHIGGADALTFFRKKSHPLRLKSKGKRLSLPVGGLGIPRQHPRYVTSVQWLQFYLQTEQNKGLLPVRSALFCFVFLATLGVPTGRIGSRQQVAETPWLVSLGCSGGAQRSCRVHLHIIQLGLQGKPLF